MISKEEYVEWRHNIVTKEFYRAIDLDIQELMETLAASAGINSANDSRLRGIIEGLKAVREWEPKETTE